ncbi:MAG: esterase [Alphaproteobacteria bacterium]|nr:MAG: esterase [Alphaproteobacteria bacterium]
MTIDPQTQALLDQINQLVADPDAPPSMADTRIGAHALFTGFEGEIEQGCRTEDRQIPTGEGGVPVRIYHPGGDSVSSLLPIVVFFHGGGWSLGDVAAYDSLVRSLCVLSGTIYVSVDYRLAPEHKYPAGLNDCLAVTDWLLSNGAEIGGDSSRLAVMGDSAGGNLAAVVTHQINSRQPHSIRAQFLLYPVMDISQPHDHYPSRMALGNGEYLLSREGIDKASDWYLTNENDRADPALSPACQSELSPLPPTVIVVGGYDPLRDEARAYHDRLTSVGVQSLFKCYPSTIHAFLSFGLLDVAQQGRRYIADQVQRLLHPGQN